MNCVVFVLCEVNQVHPIFLTVQWKHFGPLLAVVDDDLVICTAGDHVHPVVAEVDVGDLVLVVLVLLCHVHRPEQGTIQWIHDCF